MFAGSSCQPCKSWQTTVGGAATCFALTTDEQDKHWSCTQDLAGSFLHYTCSEMSFLDYSDLSRSLQSLKFLHQSWPGVVKQITCCEAHGDPTSASHFAHRPQGKMPRSCPAQVPGLGLGARVDSWKDLGSYCLPWHPSKCQREIQVSTFHAWNLSLPCFESFGERCMFSRWIKIWFERKRTRVPNGRPQVFEQRPLSANRSVCTATFGPFAGGRARDVQGSGLGQLKMWSLESNLTGPSNLQVSSNVAHWEAPVNEGLNAKTMEDLPLPRLIAGGHVIFANLFELGLRLP